MIAFSHDAYVKLLKQLLPPGAAFNVEAGSTVSKVLDAIADEFVRIDARSVDLMNEADPRTANETLADWEKMLSLPDLQVPVIPATTAGRQVAITQKYVATGGQTAAFFIALAAACGYVVTITTFVAKILRVGFRVNDRVYGAEYAYAMQFNVSPPAGTALAHADFERVIRHATHAHIKDIFVYL